jgi:hypothetical protein
MCANDNRTPDPERSLFSEGDGSSFANTVATYTPSGIIGVPAEYPFVSNQYGRPNLAWNLIRQSLRTSCQKYYDLLVIGLKNGEARSIFSDLSAFFGK